MRKKRRKRKTSGSRLLALALMCWLPTVCAEKKKADAPHGLITVTVFREPGLAVPGAEVTVTPQPEDGQPAVDVKKFKLRSVTDARGEAAFRVPVVKLRYSLQAKANGFGSQEKSVTIEGENHVEVTFVLARESK